MTKVTKKAFNEEFAYSFMGEFMTFMVGNQAGNGARAAT